MLGARNGLAHSHSLLFRGAADAFPELGALRRRRYRGQRPCGGQEEQAAHRCFVVSRVQCACQQCSLAELVVACESCTRRDCTNRCSTLVLRLNTCSTQVLRNKVVAAGSQPISMQQCCERPKTKSAEGRISSWHSSLATLECVRIEEVAARLPKNRAGWTQSTCTSHRLRVRQGVKRPRSLSRRCKVEP